MTYLSYNGKKIINNGNYVSINLDWDNFGQNWNISNQLFGETYLASLFITSKGTLLAGTGNLAHVLRSTDKGLNWNDKGRLGTQVYVYGFCEGLNNNIFAACTISSTSGALYKSIDDGSTWSNVNMGSITSLGQYCIIYCENGIILIGTQSTGRIYRSIDNGATWTDLGQMFSQLNISSLLYVGNGVVLAGTQSGGKILRSINDGSTWTDIGQQAGQVIISSLEKNDFTNTIYAGTGSNCKFLKSNDLGLSWTDFGTIDASNARITSILCSHNKILIGTGNTTSKIYKSINDGSTWSNVLIDASNNRVSMMTSFSNGTVLATLGANTAKIARSIIS